MNYFLIFALVVVTLNLSLVTSTSDPASGPCESICWEEDALAEQCIEDNACASDSLSRAEANSCRRLCEVNVVVCQAMCRRNFELVLGECWPGCESSSEENCSWNCFYDKMMKIKMGDVGLQSEEA